MVDICLTSHLKSTTTTTPLNSSTSPTRVTTATIVGAVVFGGMFLGLLAVLFYAGWAYNRGLDPNGPHRRLTFPRLGVFRAWLDPQAQMFSVSLGGSRGPEDAELASRPYGGPVVARPARVLHEPLPAYEHPPPYGLGGPVAFVADTHSGMADSEATTAPDTVAGRTPI